MSDEKKNIFASISIGNIITAGVIIVGVITTWSKIQFHISDDTIHLDPTEIVLTKEEYNNLTKTLTIIKDKFETIDDNKDLLNALDKNFSVFLEKFENLKNSHNYLKDKQGRNYKELNNEIKTLHE